MDVYIYPTRKIARLEFIEFINRQPRLWKLLNSHNCNRNDMTIQISNKKSVKFMSIEDADRLRGCSIDSIYVHEHIYTDQYRLLGAYIQNITSIGGINE